MLLDISPLKRHRDYRLLYIGQFVSALGSFLTYVALPVQIFQLTRSSAMVGLLGTVQLVPLAVTALWGGAVADAIDRRKLVRICEVLLLLGSATLMVNAMLPHPGVTTLFIAAAFMSAVAGFHTPALESMTPQLVDRDDLASVGALRSTRDSIAQIAGPAVAGVCIATVGMPFTFGVDVASFAVSLVVLTMMRAVPPSAAARAPGFATIMEGVRYAASRPELIGTYVVDLTAMIFAMPYAVFPALAERWGSSGEAGYLFSAMSCGALLMSVFSGWTRRVHRHGAAVIVAATAWGIAVVLLGHAGTLWMAMVCLALAGAADMVSGLFRMTIWNETIPTHIRGRMAGIEQLSYTTGPLLGNARVGFMAERFGIARAVTWGGIACVVGVLSCIPLLPVFWKYRRSPTR